MSMDSDDPPVILENPRLNDLAWKCWPLICEAIALSQKDAKEFVPVEKAKLYLIKYMNTENENDLDDIFDPTLQWMMKTNIIIKRENEINFLSKSNKSESI